MASASPGSLPFVEVRESDCGVVSGVTGSGVVTVKGLDGGFVGEVVSIPAVVEGGLGGSILGEVVGLSSQSVAGGFGTFAPSFGSGSEAGDVYVRLFDSATRVCSGDPVVRTLKPLSVELGPGLMGGFFDGIQRSLEPLDSEEFEFAPNTALTCGLDRERLWEFTPLKGVREGDVLGPGDIFGYVQESAAFLHKIMVPPNVAGRVSFVAEPGTYSLLESVLELVEEGTLAQTKKKVFLSHTWPVHSPRPITERLPVCETMSTGLRVLDSFFPVAKGGSCVFPAAFGKSGIRYTMARYSPSDAMVYVGAAERGTEMAEVSGGFCVSLFSHTFAPHTVLLCHR
jgi:V-type H+-transporting ATPase subunit A